MTTSGRAFKKPHTGSIVRLYFAEPTWQEKYRELERTYGVVDAKLLDEFCIQIVTMGPIVSDGLWIRDSAWPEALAKESPKEACFVGAVNLAHRMKKMQRNGVKNIDNTLAQAVVWDPIRKKRGMRPGSIRHKKAMKREAKANAKAKR